MLDFTFTEEQNMLEKNYFFGNGGLKLFFRSYRTDDSQNIFILVHGLGEHSGRYSNFIDFFIQKNFSLYCFDLLGHGLSSGRRGHVSNFNGYLLDLKEFCSLVKNKEANKNIFLIGHSLGGLIILRYIQEFGQGLKGVIASSPALKSIIPISNFKTYLINFLNDILPEITFSNQINPIYLSHDTQVIESYRKDKLVHNRISVRCFTEISKAMLEVYKKVDLIKFPCLLLQAGDDKIVSGAAINSFFKRIKAPYKQLNIYPDFYHELFNEVGQKKVFQDIYNWVLTLIKERGNI